MIAAQPVTQQLTVLGKSANVVVTATGSNLVYQWQKDGTDIPGAVSSMFAIENVTRDHEGLYLCLVSNVAGSVTSTAVSLTVCKCFIIQ